jgi:hypothetical protein
MKFLDASPDAVADEGAAPSRRRYARCREQADGKCESQTSLGFKSLNTSGHQASGPARSDRTTPEGTQMAGRVTPVQSTSCLLTPVPSASGRFRTPGPDILPLTQSFGMWCDIALSASTLWSVVGSCAYLVPLFPQRSLGSPLRVRGIVVGHDDWEFLDCLPHLETTIHRVVSSEVDFRVGFTNRFFI